MSFYLIFWCLCVLVGWVVVQRFVVCLMQYLAAIWLRRSEILMGRIPSLGVHGDRLATSSLLFDGRARSFAVGPRFESLNITSFGRLPLC